MLAGDPWQESLEERLERLRKSGQIGPLAVALPDAFTKLGGCQYLSSPAVGDYERYLWEELPAALAEHFRVGRQGVAGKSSGGFGALIHGMRRPALLQAVVCHSGDMGFDISVFPNLPRLMNAIRDHGSVEELVSGHQRSHQKKDGRWFAPMEMLALGSVYSPDRARPLGIQLPFDTQTGRLLEGVLDRWRSFDPVRRVETLAQEREALKGQRLLYFDCGRHDEYGLHWGARQLSAALRAAGIPHEHEEFEGGHRNTAHRLDISLPKLYRALA